MQPIDPVAFHVFGLPVYWYGIMIALGMLLGLIVSLRRTKQYGISEDKVIHFLIVAVPLAIVGARFVFVVLNWDIYSGNVPEMLSMNLSGISLSLLFCFM
jgi:prolipoprotein diacylglyceryltransferase